MKSKVIELYTEWLAKATKEQIEFVDSVYHLAEQHYCHGGDNIVECLDPEDILKEFKNLNDVREYAGLKIEQELNARWGEDDDPELKRSKAFEENWK